MTAPLGVSRAGFFTPRICFSDMVDDGSIIDRLPYPGAGLPKGLRSDDIDVAAPAVPRAALWVWRKGEEAPTRYWVRNGHAFHEEDPFVLWHFPGEAVWYRLDAWTSAKEFTTETGSWRHPGPPRLKYFTRVVIGAADTTVASYEPRIALPCAGWAWLERLHTLVRALERLYSRYQTFATHAFRAMAWAKQASAILADGLARRADRALTGDLARLSGMREDYDAIVAIIVRQAMEPTGPGARLQKRFVNVAWMIWRILSDDRFVGEMHALARRGLLAIEHRAIVAAALRGIAALPDPMGTWDFAGAAHDVMRPWIKLARPEKGVPSAFRRTSALPAAEGVDVSRLAIVCAPFVPPLALSLRSTPVTLDARDELRKLEAVADAADAHLAAVAAVAGEVGEDTEGLLRLRSASLRRAEATLLRRKAARGAAPGAVLTAPLELARSHALYREAEEEVEKVAKDLRLGRGGIGVAVDTVDAIVALWRFYDVVDHTTVAGLPPLADMDALAESAGSLVSALTGLAGGARAGRSVAALGAIGGAMALPGDLLELHAYSTALDAKIRDGELSSGSRVVAHLAVSAGKILGIWGATASAASLPMGPLFALFGAALEGVGVFCLEIMDDDDLFRELERHLWHLRHELSRYEGRFRGMGVTPEWNKHLFSISRPLETRLPMPDEIHDEEGMLPDDEV